jgi:predicted transcriptional regulator
MSAIEKIVIRQVNRPGKEDINNILEWFCEVFDLAGKGDEIEPAIFKEIVSNSMEGGGVTSKDLTEELNMPRSTVIYHLNRFIYTGLVIRRGRKYYLRSEDLPSTLEEIQADMSREFVRMINMAQRMNEIFEEDIHARRKGKRQ